MEKCNLIVGIPGTTSRRQMNVNRIIEYAGTFHKDQEVVCLTKEGVFRYTYGKMYERVKRLASALQKLGVEPPEAVTVFGSNTHQTIEALYAIIGLGASAFTANVRIPPEHLFYCVNHVSEHAVNKIAILEPEHMDLVVRTVRATGKSFDHYIILGHRQNLTSSPPFESVYYSEELIEKENTDFEWREIDENTAAVIMFTTGTTGRPKPVAHTHRMIWLHSAGMCASLSISAKDSILLLPAVYHLGWLLWTEAPFVGAKLVIPGSDPTPKDYVDLIINEKITFTAGVPTLLKIMLEDLKASGQRLDSLSIYFAGQAPPPGLIHELDNLGANARQLFGFTEAGPHFVENAPRNNQDFKDAFEYAKFKASVAGFCCCGAEIKILDEQGKELPWDGKSTGTIAFRALWASTEYWHDPESTSSAHLGDGWMQIGDIGTIDSNGYLRVLDRAKDAIKSGGEWIPSPVLEGVIDRHPGVAEVAVIAAEHPKWMERPIAIVRPTPEYKNRISEQDIHSFLMEQVHLGEINKYWIPDRIIFVDDIPKTSVGKYDKKVLRDQYKSILLK